MKLIKILLSALGILVLVSTAVVWYVLSNINDIVKEVVVSVGSEVLQTPVSLGAVDIKLKEGAGTLSTFAIQNYPGFNEPNLLAFDTIRVDIDPKSVTNEVIVIDELTISGVDVVVEQNDATTNIQSLFDALDDESGSSPAPSSSGAEESSKTLYFAIKKLNFVDNRMTLATEDYGKHSLDLPKIVQTNIGSEKQGLTPEQLAVAIAKPLLASAKKRVETGLRELAKKELTDKLEKKLGVEKEKLEQQAEEKKKELEQKVDQEKSKLEKKLEDKIGKDAEKKLKDLKKLF